MTHGEPMVSKTFHMISSTFEPETPEDFFTTLEEAQRLTPDYAKIYQIYARIFQQVLDQKTQDTRIQLCGIFAKTDYLLKKYEAPPSLVKSVNDTRVRLRHRSQLSEDSMGSLHLHDLRNLCQWIAFLYRVKIPAALVALFPTKKPAAFSPTLMSDCIRVVVQRWDDEFVYGPSEESSEGKPLKISYSHDRLLGGWDWSYLRELFSVGAYLNLIHAHEDDGILYPEIIIYEPDYLINISTIARCFETYAESPMVDLLKKLEPTTESQPILLGQFASQLLDEAIHQLPATHTYAQSVKDFFENYAINLLLANVSPSFHEDAKNQQANIHKAIKYTLPHDIQDFDPKEGMVEPSFFCEMLGMQGRMDYLQQDFKVLMEQKSGKGNFPYDHFIIPRHKVEHYVQLLLYMALIRYNFRKAYESNGKKIHAFLLYSKYQESLLNLGFAPDLLFRAIKVRNQLAKAELRYAEPDGFRILETLKPEDVNEKHFKSSLWDDYQRKQINNILVPIQQASETERAYYFRFLTFIANEHVLAKLGNRCIECAGFASTWLNTLDEKRSAGNIYDHLTMVSPDASTQGRIETVTLRFSETADNDMSNFRTGDIVILYPYMPGEEPDARQTMVFRCTIDAILPDTIRLILRASQTDNRVFLKEQGKLWAIEHDFMESSFSQLYKGMHAFLSAPKSRRDLLMLKRAPETDDSRLLLGDYGAFNELQQRVKRAKDLFLIIGPPGTGKTSFGLLYTLKEELLEPESSVLLMAYTNRAIDEICSKLTEAGIDFIRMGSSACCPEPYKRYLLKEKVKGCGRLPDIKQLILTTRVFVGTTTSVSSRISLLQLKRFSLAIIDEASQILEPHLMGLLSAHQAGIPSIGKMVLIGDHKQLPAVVQQPQETSLVREPLLHDILLTDCRLSLFERLLRKYEKNSDVTYLLRKQGRMHPDIAEFSNHTFYNDQLEAVPLPHQLTVLPENGTGMHGIEALLTTRHIAFVAAAPPADSPSDKVNQVEADLIAATVVKIYEMEKDHFDVRETVGIIVPYRNQIATIRNTIDKYGIPLLHDITIDTVERYQGSQRQYIIYGFTIQKYYQLDFLTSNVFIDSDGNIVDRKLNVAMTRAKEHLIMVGNPHLLSRNVTFHLLLSFMRDKKSYIDVSKEDFLSGHFALT